MNQYYIYIMTNKPYGVLYIGITNNLRRRVLEHKNGSTKGFTHKYNLHCLVYFEETVDVKSAIVREKQLKKWNRLWKITLIEKMNPVWKDLFEEEIPDQVGDDNSA
jgi:putative endonuclease